MRILSVCKENKNNNFIQQFISYKVNSYKLVFIVSQALSSQNMTFEKLYESLVSHDTIF